MKNIIKEADKPFEIGYEKDLEGNLIKNEVGIIVDIEEGMKPSSRSRGITRKYLIGKKFQVTHGNWTWSHLHNNDTEDYKLITGRLEDGRYFEVDGAKIKRFEI